MARARSGGSRQGTPGRGYSNRTDLLTNYGQSAPGASAASGGMVAPAQPAQPQEQYIRPDDVPKLDDPSSYPDRPVTYGLDVGPGAGTEALGVVPGNRFASDVAAAYLRNPTPELRRILALIQMQGWDR